MSCMSVGVVLMMSACLRRCRHVLMAISSVKSVSGGRVRLQWGRGRQSSSV